MELGELASLFAPPDDLALEVEAFEQLEAVLGELSLLTVPGDVVVESAELVGDVVPDRVVDLIVLVQHHPTPIEHPEWQLDARAGKSDDALPGQDVADTLTGVGPIVRRHDQQPAGTQPVMDPIEDEASILAGQDVEDVVGGHDHVEQGELIGGDLPKVALVKSRPRISSPAVLEHAWREIDTLGVGSDLAQIAGQASSTAAKLKHATG